MRTVAYAMLAATVLAYWHALPCATEDSNGCTWYADLQGNGEGATFTALPWGTVLHW